MEKALWVSLKKVVHWLLFLVVALMLLSGFGIVDYQVVQTITFGILNKATAFQLHINLWWVLIVLLALHVLLTMQTQATKDKGT
jgi:thiosulfate reductase cytochrome b subunit